MLDFIGNYEKAGNAPFLLSGKAYSNREAREIDQRNFEYPEGCLVDFDMRLVDLFQEMAKKGRTIKERIKEEYLCVKERMDGRVPTRMELYAAMDDMVYEICKRNSNASPFKRYLEFLYDLKELSKEEEKLYQGEGRAFIHTLEMTSMTKSYKMPILLAFYNDGDVKMNISGEDVCRSYKRFYNRGINWKDLERDKSSRGYKDWTEEDYLRTARDNPIHFLKKSGNGFFVEKEGCELALKDSLKQVIGNPALVRHMKDVIEYRTMEYYRKFYFDRL